MSAVLEFLPEARCDAEEATGFYERRVPGLGARFRAEVESVCAAIVRQPLLWNVAYFIRGERIVVAAVGHATRHPDHWKRRES